MQPELDQDVVNLAKAIRQSESGGNFNAQGKSGERGAYQFTEDTWNASAPKYQIKSSLKDATDDEQNAVAYNRIKAWKDSGKDVTQIASMWNAGEGEPDAYKGKFGSTTKTHKAGDPSIGINSYGAKYDVPSYAKSVSSAYLSLKNGGQVSQDPNNPSSVPPQPGQASADGFVRTANLPEGKNNNKVQENPTDAGHVLSNIGKGDFKNAAISGVKNVGKATGITDLGDYIGGELAYGTEKLKGMLGGKDNSKFIQREDASKGLSGGSKVTGLIGGLASLGAGSGLLAQRTLTNPSIVRNLPLSLGKTGKAAQEAFLKLSKKEQLNTLGGILEEAKGLGKLGDVNAITKAIKILQPSAGFVKGLLGRVKDVAIYETLKTAFGDKVGGAIQRVTGL